MESIDQQEKNNGCEERLLTELEKIQERIVKSENDFQSCLKYFEAKTENVTNQEEIIAKQQADQALKRQNIDCYAHDKLDIVNEHNILRTKLNTMHSMLENVNDNICENEDEAKVFEEIMVLPNVDNIINEMEQFLDHKIPSKINKLEEDLADCDSEYRELNSKIQTSQHYEVIKCQDLELLTERIKILEEESKNNEQQLSTINKHIEQVDINIKAEEEKQQILNAVIRECETKHCNETRKIQLMLDEVNIKERLVAEEIQRLQQAKDEQCELLLNVNLKISKTEQSIQNVENNISQCEVDIQNKEKDGAQLYLVAEELFEIANLADAEEKTCCFLLATFSRVIRTTATASVASKVQQSF